MMARVGTTCIGGFELHRSGEFIGLEYLKEIFSGSDAEHEEDQASLMKKKKKALVSFPSPIRVRDWSELPRDISNLIGDRIKFLPHLEKFGVACKEWRDIADERNKIARAEIKSEPPMLLLPFNEETQMATFLEMIKGKKYNLKMPELKGQWICGASKGWLAMTDDNLDLFLFNPLTRARIKLPPLDPYLCKSFRENYSPMHRWYRTCFVKRVVLSDDPSSSNCLVAILYSLKTELGICRLGNENWTVADSECESYHDIIFFQGKIFTSLRTESVHVFDYARKRWMSTPRLIPSPMSDSMGCQYKRYLVESCGKLLLVVRFGRKKKIIGNKKPRRPLKTWRFEVHRLKGDMESWDTVKSLGERSLFLGPNDSLSVSTKELPWCKPSCIYFTHECQDFWGENGYQWDNGVYSLTDNRVIEKLDTQHS